MQKSAHLYLFATTAARMKTMLSDKDEEILADCVYCTNRDMEKYGWIYLGEADVSADFIPFEEYSKAAIAELKQKKQNILAEAEKAVQELDQQIQELLAIPYKPEE